MGYHPPYGKAKKKGEKRRPVDDSTREKTYVATMKEVSDKTLKRLHILGNQKFGSSPFSEYFERWLVNLTDVLSEFESNPNIKADNQFVEERSQILSGVKIALDERRRNEASLEEASENLSNSKNLLTAIKKEYDERMSEIRGQKNSAIRHLNKDIERLRKELDYIARMKTGLFRGISKKEREQKEIETTRELNSKERQLELTMLKFTEAKEKLQDEYEKKRQPLIQQIRDCQKKIETLETDGSREDRWFACEALIDSVNELLERKTLQLRKPF